MRKVYFFILAMVLMAPAYLSYGQQYFLEEGFEGGELPEGWSDEILEGERDWRYENGGYALPSQPNFRHPPSAYAGSFNALFQDESTGPESRLITNKIDMRTAIKPELTFWHAMEKWGEDVDELRVYFRPDSTYEWELLEEYLNPTSNWVQRIILLPDEAKTQYAQIAFQAKSKWGWGVCVDEIKIEEKGILPRKVETFAVKQTTEYLPTGSDINPLGYISTFISGNDGTIGINSIALNFTGTSISDITQVSLFHTRDSIFSVTTPIESEIAIDGNTITITAPDFSLLTGDNVVWICFDIAADATHGNTIDYTYATNSVDLGGTTFPSTAQNPTGQGTIEESLVFDNMETSEGWTLDNDWEIGAPTGLGTYDPTHPFSGLQVMATNLDDDYATGILPTNPHTAVSNAVNAKFYKNLNVRYKRWLNIDYFDRASVKVSNDNGSTWSTVNQTNSSIFDRSWKSISHNISTQATRKENVKIMFSMDTTNNNLEYGGWNVDNFAITGDYIAQDVGVLNLVEPIQICGLSGSELIKVTIKNFGGETVSTPFNVGYSLNNGVSYTVEEFNGTIESEGDSVFTFATPANLSSPGLKNLKFRTYLTGDEDALNDIFSKSIYVFPTVAYPYQASFETTSSFWYPSGTNSSWQWGTPNGTVLNKASDGTKVWITSLSASYKNNEFSYLESPCFNLSEAQYPLLAFDYMMVTEEGVDGFTLEYSIDGGISWAELPEHEGYAYNWYDTENVTALGTAGWSVNQTDYVTVKNLLPEDVKTNGVKFRFVFASNESEVFEGIAVDNIKVYELPYDVGVTQLISPEDACEIGAAVKLEFRIENFGYRPVPKEVAIPLMVKVNEAVPVSESITLVDTLLQGQNVEFETANNYNLYEAKFHNIVAYTNFTTEDNRLNDTLTTQVEVYGLPGYSLGPDLGLFPPIDILLDAGFGYEVDETWTFLWTPGAVANQTLEVTAEGTYSVIVTNDRGCPATDEIFVLESDNDIAVTAILNLTSECEQIVPVSPQVTLTNFGPGTYDGVDGFPVVVMVDGVEVLEEEHVPELGWGPDDTFNYTFTGTIDLSEIKSYDIRIYPKLPKDLVKTNDTTKVTITTYGNPIVDLYTKYGVNWNTVDSVSTTRADTLTFKVDEIFDTYLWTRKPQGSSTWTEIGTSSQLLVNSVTGNKLISAWYKVKVTDVNGCGFDEDSVYVNARDLGVYSIDSPEDTVCYNPEGVLFTMTIENFGQDTYPIGSEIQATCITPAETQEVTIETEAELPPGNRIVVEFTTPIHLIEGENFIRLSTSVDGDPNPSNDFKEMILVVTPSPSVTIEPDTLYKIFRNDVYEISPEYSTDCVSYLWQDGATDSLYYLSGTPLYEVYKVEVQNEFECPASDSLVVISNDLTITAIKSPVSACELTNDLTVIFTLLNNGNMNYLAGETITVNLFANGIDMGSQEVELATNLIAGQSRDITLSQGIDLEGFTSANILVEIETTRLEVNPDNNSLNKTVYSVGYPTVTLGEDREIHAFEELLDPGLFDTYLWQDASTDQTFTATESGTYSVQVTDFSGCEGSADVTLTFYVDDLSIISLDEPVSDCNLTNAENVVVTIENTGTWTIPEGTDIEIGFSHDTDNKTETYKFDAPFEPESTLQITLDNTIDMSVRKVHSINAWVTLENDMVEENNTIIEEVSSHPDVQVEFGSDTIFINGPYVLDPGEYFSYIWSTGETTPTITVSESGKFWVDVFNQQGCTDNDTVIIEYNLPDIQIFELNTPESDCTLSDAEQVTVTIQNMGEYVYPAEDSVFLTLWLDLDLIAKDTLILSSDLGLGQSINYTFSEMLNLSQIGLYNIAIAIHHSVDANPDNDTTEYAINHWGNPTVSLGDDFEACSDDNPTLDAGVEGVTYLWSTGATTQTISPTESGTYGVTITDSNGCQASDAIFVTIKPSPNVTLADFDPVCSNTPSFTLNQGSPTGGIYSGTGVNNGIFDPAISGVGTFTITYTYTALNGCVGSETGDLTVNLAPEINLGGDQTVTAPLVLDPGSGFVSYLWQDGSTEQTFTVTESGVYYVTVTDGNGCEGYDEVNITYLDPKHNVVITELISPVEICRIPSLPVTVALRNDGDLTLNSGDSFEITYQVEGRTPVSETLTLSSVLAPTNTTEYTFNQGVSLTSGNHNISFWTSVGTDVSTINTYTAIVYPVPNLNLGPDTFLVESYPYTLLSGVSNVTYEWNTGSTQSYIVVNQNGRYWLTVTNSYGCQASDTIYITDGTYIGTIPGSNTIVSIFPNPVKDLLNLTITADRPDDYKIEIFSPLGRKVYQNNTRIDAYFDEKLDVTKYGSGINLLRVSNSKGHIVIKVLILK